MGPVPTKGPRCSHSFIRGDALSRAPALAIRNRRWGLVVLTWPLGRYLSPGQSRRSARGVFHGKQLRTGGCPSAPSPHPGNAIGLRVENCARQTSIPHRPCHMYNSRKFPIKRLGTPCRRGVDVAAPSRSSFCLFTTLVRNRGSAVIKQKAFRQGGHGRCVAVGVTGSAWSDSTSVQDSVGVTAGSWNAGTSTLGGVFTIT